jgi:putative ABC transport system permease protein
MTRPDWRTIVRGRLTSITGDAAHDEDIVEELAQHLAQRFDEHLRRGLPAADARERVLAELDDPESLTTSIRSAARSRRPAPAPPSMGGRPSMWNDLIADLRYGTRVLLRSRGFAAAAVCTLALGIGATTAIFSVVNAVLLRPVPFEDLDRLTMVWQTDRNTGTVREPSSLPDYLDVEERSTQFSNLAVFARRGRAVPRPGCIRLGGRLMASRRWTPRPSWWAQSSLETPGP